MSSQTLPDAKVGLSRPAELAPSTTMAREPKFAQLLGVLGGCGVALGFAIVFVNVVMGPRPIGTPIGVFSIIFGLIGLLYHALRDGDIQVRRTYASLGFALLGLAVILVLPNFVNFLLYSWACLLAGLCFLLCCLRYETETGWRNTILSTLWIAGVLMAGFGIIGGITLSGFLPSYGLILAVLGLFYLCAYISQADPMSRTGYQTGLAIGGVAALLVLYVVSRWAINAGFKMNWPPFFVPTGLLLLFVAVLYGVVSLGIISNNHLVVLTRRELSDYFYSPVAYIVMFAMGFLAAIAYYLFIDSLARGAIRYEPIVLRYFGNFPPFIVIFVVPAITMRLLAEEKRSGTYEVLMCAPVRESSVVASKFLACLIFFMLVWSIWSVYLIGLRAESGKEFDYRPILSFYLVIACSGSGFVAMGLFFSSLSRNQIVAAILTFVAMLFLLLLKLVPQLDSVGGVWQALARQLSYLELWDAALRGRLMVRDMVLQASFAFFWLFLTVKVLEARRWS